MNRYDLLFALVAAIVAAATWGLPAWQFVIVQCGLVATSIIGLAEGSK